VGNHSSERLKCDRSPFKFLFLMCFSLLMNGDRPHFTLSCVNNTWENSFWLVHEHIPKPLSVTSYLAGLLVYRHIIQWGHFPSMKEFGDRTFTLGERPILLLFFFVQITINFDFYSFVHFFFVNNSSTWYSNLLAFSCDVTKIHDIQSFLIIQNFII